MFGLMFRQPKPPHQSLGITHARVVLGRNGDTAMPSKSKRDYKPRENRRRDRDERLDRRNRELRDDRRIQLTDRRAARAS